MSSSTNHSHLPIAEGNNLILTNRKRTEKHGMDNDDEYWDEVTSSGEVVAKYHIWYYMNIYPPQKSDEGWEKFDLAGNKISSGKCC
ncbi:hypothetical protein AGMMS50256_11070 [Betaproteobacteria bacterium]|nr:hypothetical protein AGMMS50256_11070 [Betaproteobacteria bacterium]